MHNQEWEGALSKSTDIPHYLLASGHSTVGLAVAYTAHYRLCACVIGIGIPTEPRVPAGSELAWLASYNKCGKELDLQ